MEEVNLNEFARPEMLRELVTTKMPFGKYKGTLLADLPAYYLEWFKSQGFPKGKIGEQLETMYEIKTNGLDMILRTLRKIGN